ncbi:MAG: NADH:flavin oxidoreductase/NADH oxidase [Nitrosomonadales bacterium]|nr:NADH:flavin oxidoreductase/NADH oxidase [Nitrosomonadales bacterium]
MSQLFSRLKLRELEFRNRIFVSPMCQYSARDGIAQTWHQVHLGSRAVGGAGLVMVEATAVAPEGRISPYDLGLWSDRHAEALAPIARFIREQGAAPAIQLAHAGRKASSDAPWLSRNALTPKNGGWQVVAPSPAPFSPASPQPRELAAAELDGIVAAFVAAAKRSLAAGFEVAEIHMAHGYLLHEFLSPLSNRRNDAHGGSLENRARLPLQVVRAVRDIWPQRLPLFVRISATDWVEGGWDLGQSLQLCRWLKEAGVDLIDCSTGGLTPDAKIPAGPGFQTPFATAIRQHLGIAVGAVGLITAPEQAEHIVATGLADVVFLARELLRDPYWPLHAAHKLGAAVQWPVQYERAKPV